MMPICCYKNLADVEKAESSMIRDPKQTAKAIREFADQIPDKKFKVTTRTRTWKSGQRTLVIEIEEVKT